MAMDSPEHRGQAAHGTGSTGPRHFEIGFAADEQCAAECLVPVALVDGDGFARENGFIQHGAASIHERPVCWDAVAGFEAHPVAGNQGMCRKTDELAIAEYPCLGSSQGLQPSQGRFGPLFLIEAERRVEQEDQTDGRRFDWPGVRAFVEPEAEIKDEGEQQDVDERTLELTHEPAPERIGRLLGQGVRPDARESFGGFSGRKSVHRDAMCLGKSRASLVRHPPSEATAASFWFCDAGFQAEGCRKGRRYQTRLLALLEDR